MACSRRLTVLRDPKASLRTAIFLWELMVEKGLRHSLPLTVILNGRLKSRTGCEASAKVLHDGDWKHVFPIL